jgi:hypothetical protein
MPMLSRHPQRGELPDFTPQYTSVSTVRFEVLRTSIIEIGGPSREEKISLEPQSG